MLSAIQQAVAESAEIIFKNDFRWSPQVLPWHDMLLLLEGQTVHLPAPKSHFAKDLVFDTDTPIFCTGKHELLFIKAGCIDEKETEMMRVRWRLFSFFSQIPEHERRHIPPCSRCFATFILDDMQCLLIVIYQACFGTGEGCCFTANMSLRNKSDRIPQELNHYGRANG